MGKKFFGIDIQSTIASAMTASDLPNFTFTKIGPSTRDPARPTAGLSPTTLATVPCWGVVSDFTLDDQIGTEQVQMGDKKIVLIAKPLADANVIPGMGDTITDDSQVYRVIAVMRDGATAAYTCQCRG